MEGMAVYGIAGVLSTLCHCARVSPPLLDSGFFTSMLSHRLPWFTSMWDHFMDRKGAGFLIQRTLSTIFDVCFQTTCFALQAPALDSVAVVAYSVVLAIIGCSTSD